MIDYYDPNESPIGLLTSKLSFILYYFRSRYGALRYESPITRMKIVFFENQTPPCHNV